MPKIFGTNLLGIVLATLAFYMVGFLIYGILFGEAWMDYAGMTEADANARNAELGAMMFVWGLVITLVQVLGISYVLQQAGASVLGTCAKIGAILATCFALPVMAYNWLYQGSSINLLGLDFAHLLLGYVLAASVMSFFRGAENA